MRFEIPIVTRTLTAAQVTNAWHLGGMDVVQLFHGSDPRYRL